MNLMNKKKLITFISFFVLLVLFNSCEKDISTAPPEEEPPQGFIFVDSNPQNYKIYLDGRFTGRFTPDTLRYVEETEHFIELKKSHWLDSNVIISAKYETVESVYVDFFQNPKIYGNLEFYSEPVGAVVEIDDSLTTITTPGKITGILPGMHNIKYHLAEHRSNSANVIVESNKIRKVTLALQDTSVWVDYTVTKSSLPNNHITTLAVDSNNVVWAGTIDKGALSIKGNKWEFLNTKNSIIPSDRIKSIEIDKNNTVWLGTDKGLVEYSNGTIKNIYDYNNTKLRNNSQINDIDFFDDKVVAGTIEGLLIISSDGSSELFEVKNSEEKSEVTSIAINENSGYLWVGVRGLMLTYTIRNGEVLRSPKSNNIGSSVSDLELTKLIQKPTDGNLWALFSSLSTKNPEGDIVHPTPYLTLWNGTKWYYQRLEGDNLMLLDATVSRDNYIWIATNEGLRKQETIRSAVIIRSYNTGLFSDKLTAVEEDANRVLWIGSENGLFKYKRYK